jgi:hypothetical protein
MSPGAPIEKFVIYAHARSGSSNLLEALQLHPGLHIAEEPFHEKYALWNPGEPNHIDLIRDERSLDAAVAHLFRHHDGIKVLDYQLDQSLYRRLLLREDVKVIGLRRRNQLQAIVSGQVASQTGVWKMWDLKTDLASTYASLAPISAEEVAERLQWGRELHAFYQDVMACKPAAQRLLLEYETLYTDHLNHNRDVLAGVFAFLGLTLPDSPKLDYYLDPGRCKLSGRGDYRYLPNAAEINARFGNDETGWLWPPT